MIWLLLGFAVFILASLGSDFAAGWVYRQINDPDVRLEPSLIGYGEPRRIMAIWAHPDDEITCAGTLALAVKRDGAEVTLVYLTAGEAAKDTGYSPEALAAVRRKEAVAAGALLGAKHVEVLNFPDGGLPKVPARTAQAAIAVQIARHQPHILISFDEVVGFYGHPDHVQVGRWVRQVFEAGRKKKTFPARRLYQVTLPPPLIRLALRLVQAFRDNYPSDPAKGVPVPTVAVRITSVGRTKRRLLDVHASQKKIIADVQPYYDRAPAWLYYRLFDREYFAEVS